MTRPAFTPARLAVLRELCRDGADNRTIGARLGIGENTVKSHLRALQAATGTTTRTALVIAALRAPAVTHLAGDDYQRTACCRQPTDRLPDRDHITRTIGNVTCGGHDQ